jgi:hypothetical protein
VIMAVVPVLRLQHFSVAEDCYPKKRLLDVFAVTVQHAHAVVS